MCKRELFKEVLFYDCVAKKTIKPGFNLHLLRFNICALSVSAF